MHRGSVDNSGALQLTRSKSQPAHCLNTTHNNLIHMHLAQVALELLFFIPFNPFLRAHFWGVVENQGVSRGVLRTTQNSNEVRRGSAEPVLALCRALFHSSKNHLLVRRR